MSSSSALRRLPRSPAQVVKTWNERATAAMRMDTRVSPHMRALQTQENGRQWVATNAAGLSGTAGCSLTRAHNASACKCTASHGHDECCYAYSHQHDASGATGHMCLG